MRQSSVFPELPPSACAAVMSSIYYLYFGGKMTPHRSMSLRGGAPPPDRCRLRLGKAGPLILAILGALLLVNGVLAKHSSKKGVPVRTHRKCPEPYVLDEKRSLCIMTHAMPPMKICPNGVLRDGLCFIMAMPDRTPCPGGFMEQLVDGDKICVATRVARMRMACWGPFEKLVGDECVERIAGPLIIECLKGSLNFEQKCENIILETPKAVCKPGFFELEGLCVRRREIPCVAETQEAMPMPSMNEKVSLSRDWAKERVSSFASLPSKTTALPFSSDFDQMIDKPYTHSVVGGTGESNMKLFPMSTFEASDSTVYHGGSVPATEFVEGVPFGEPLREPYSLVSYSLIADPDFDSVAGAERFAQVLSNAESRSTRRWSPAGSKSFPGGGDEPADLTYTPEFIRRLQATQQLHRIETPEKPKAAQTGQEKTAGGALRGEDVPLDDPLDAERPPEASNPPRQAMLGLPLLPLQTSLPVGLPLSTMSQYRPLTPLVSPGVLGMPLRLPPLYRPLWHDNRFGFSFGPNQPNLRQRRLSQPGSTSDEGTDASVGGSFLPPSNSQHGRQENAFKAATRPDKEKSFDSKSYATSDRWKGTKAQPDEGPSRLSIDPEIPHVRPVAVSSRMKLRFARTSENTAREKKDDIGGMEDQHLPTASMPLSARAYKPTEVQPFKEAGISRLRRLEGLDYIPGCWEEEVHVPSEWSCNEHFTLDVEQHICIRIDITKPNIICDGVVEGDLCVHENRKPPQWYCPLDPPPGSEKEKKEKKKSEKKPEKKDEKKLDKKDEKKSHKKDEKKPDMKDEKKPDKKDEKKPDKKPDSPAKPGDQKKPVPGQGETKGPKKAKGGPEKPAGSQPERQTSGAGTKAGGTGGTGAAKPTKPSGAQSKGQGSNTRVQANVATQEQASTQEKQENRNASRSQQSRTERGRADAGSSTGSRQQTTSSRPQPQRRNDRQETNSDAGRPDNGGEEDESHPARRTDQNRERPSIKRRPEQKSDAAHSQTTRLNEEEAKAGGAREDDPVRSRVQQTRRKVPPPRPQEASEPAGGAHEDDENVPEESQENPRGRRTNARSGLTQTSQRGSDQARGRQRTTQSQHSLWRRERNPEPEEEADDEDERSGNLTSHVSRVRHEPHSAKQSAAETRTGIEEQKEVEPLSVGSGTGIPAHHQRKNANPNEHVSNKTQFAPHHEIESDSLEKPADAGTAGPFILNSRDERSTISHGGSRFALTSDERKVELSKRRPHEQSNDSSGRLLDRNKDKLGQLGTQPETSFAENATGTDLVEANARGEPTRPSLRRLNYTPLPYAYFIMGVNQWRYIHDPVHQLRMETAADRAREKAATSHNPPLEPIDPLATRTGVFGLPTRAGPQLYRYDLKDSKKPTVSPLKIRDGTLCYRQERKRPLVDCPPGFTANKEGGCYMMTAPAFTCLAGYFYENGHCVQHRELEPAAPTSDKKGGSKVDVCDKSPRHISTKGPALE